MMFGKKEDNQSDGMTTSHSGLIGDARKKNTRFTAVEKTFIKPQWSLTVEKKKNSRKHISD